MSAAAAEAYRQLRVTVFGEGRFAEDESPAPSTRPPELELQSRWFSGEFGREFVTTSGQRVEIVQFGTWNHAAGPDFTEVAVSLAGRRMSGSLELDWDARDWERHGHAENPAYENVVLHIFFVAPDGTRFFSRTNRHREVAQVQLDLSAFPFAGPPRLLAEARWGRCSLPLRDLPATRVRAMLEAAARHRLGRKAQRLETLASLHGWDEALFQQFAAVLGYRRNKLPMTMLAQRLPLKCLQSHPAGAEALLFGASGFLEAKIYEHAADDTREYLRGLWATWWKHRTEFTGVTHPPWILIGSRPLNHPQRRIGALAMLAKHWRTIKASLETGPKSLERTLRGLTHAYWDHHYTLTSPRSERPLAILGDTRISEVMANVAFPFWSLRRDDWWTSYASLPAALDNSKSRRAALRLLGPRPDVASFTRFLCQQQALIQIYEDFCLEDHTDCAHCVFPEQLGRWAPDT
jgi:Protein of unknown function (DUF2851)